jgi:hypothetical protein
MQFKVGDKVTYIRNGKQEKGIVKSTPETDDMSLEGTVRVVYYCNNDWDNYRDYVAATTNIIDLKIGWDEN